MLESLFSIQAVQPYLKQEFPHFKEAHDDRLFKHITFLENESDLKVRVSAVDHNYRRPSSMATQKVVPTNLVLTDPKSDIFRVKTVLSEEDHGNSESYWVTQKSMDSNKASTHNQYRLRGVTNKNWKSDWVYSELRDFDNDLIVYNMIYDVLDLMFTVHDDQIDYLMDYIVSDTFLQVIQEMSPKFSASLDPEEFKDIGMQELLTMFSNRTDHHPKEEIVSKLGEQFLVLADELKRDFKESIMSSPEEFSQLFQIYKLVDQYKERQVDFLHLLVEIFLEDRYEKLVQNANIEVLLQNDEEMGIYLNGRYEFNIKNELITSICDASPDDHFVTCVNDAVQLITEPVFFERLVYSQDEELEKFLRMVISELYTPMLAIDRHLVELETELEDTHKQDVSASIVEFTTIEDDYEIRNMLVFDVIEAVIKGDLRPTNDYHVEIMDYVLHFMNDSSKALFIDYNFDDVMKVLLNIGESFRHAYTTEFGEHQDVEVVALIDKYHIHPSKAARSLKESYFTTLSDIQTLIPTLNFNRIQEQTHIAVLDDIKKSYKTFKSSIESILQSSMLDTARHDYSVGVQHVNDESIIHQEDHVNHQYSVANEIAQDHFGMHQEDRVSHKYSTVREDAQDEFKVHQEDKVNHQYSKTRQHTQDEFAVQQEDKVKHQYSKAKQIAHDELTTYQKDNVNHQYSVKKQPTQDDFEILQNEHVEAEELFRSILLRDKKNAALKEIVLAANTTVEVNLPERIHSSPSSIHYNLYKYYLRNPNKFPILDKQTVNLSHDLRDSFLLDGKDQLHYALGLMDEGTPVGVFRLGINTLKGEVSN